MVIHTDRRDPTVDEIARAAFPSYNGRTIKIEPCEKVTLLNTEWSGGTRSEYVALLLSHPPAVKPLRYGGVPSAFAPSSGAENKVIDLPEGGAIVEHSIFCGKDMGLTIYARPSDLTDLLPEKPALSDLEKFVLYATSAYKASYNGKDRFDNTEWEREREGLGGILRSDWEAAQAMLRERKLLNARNAITNAGRNAIEGYRIN